MTHHSAVDRSAADRPAIDRSAAGRGSRRPLGLAGLTVRQLRDDLGPAGVLALLVLLVAALFTAAPAAMSAIGTAEIGGSVTAQSPNDRDLTAKSPMQLYGGPPTAGMSTDLSAAENKVWGAFAGALAHVRGEFPPAARDVTGPARFYLSTGAASLNDDPAVTNGRQMLVTLNDDPYLAEHLRLVSGRWPAPSKGVPPDTVPSGDSATVDVEVVLAQSSATAMQWKLGATRVAPGNGAILRLKLVGLLDADPDSADYLVHNPFANQPNIFDDGNRQARVTGSVFVNSADWGYAQSAGGAAMTTIWHEREREA